MLNKIVKLYNREMDTAANWVSSGDYLSSLKWAKLSSYVSNRIVTKSAKVCIAMCFKCSGCVFVLLAFFCFVIKSESIRNGSKLRPVPLPFIPLATLEAPKLHLTPEVHFVVPMCSAPYKIEFVR